MEDPENGPLLYPAIVLAENIFKAFTPAVAISIFIMILLLVCSALISGSEIAFFSLDPPHLKQLRGEKSKKNSLIIRLLERPKRLLATILISNNFVNVAIVILSTYITTELFYFKNFPVLAFVIQVIVVTSLILLIGEILPKIYATQYALRFARMMVIPLNFLQKFFYPLSSVLVRSTSFIDKRLAKKSSNISMSELSEAIDIASNGDTSEEETQILKGIVKFGDIEVKEIMKSRTDVTAVSTEMKFNELLEKILNSGYSRIPAFEETFDNIQGILYIKDLLPYLDKDDDFKWQDLLRQAFFVPENKKISDLLKEIQDKKIHLAIVVDEYGGTSGIVTLEDILEEIVGEISDEFDDEADEVLFKKLDDQNYIFEAKISLNDFCKITGIENDYFDNVKGESDSLAGLILEIEGKIPQKEANIKYRNFTFKILAADKRRIKQIKVTITNNGTIKDIKD